jgi:hypothetical protein
MTVSVVSFDVGEKQFVFDPVPAVIITITELPLDFYKFPKTPAAFPAPVAFKLYHITYLI